MSMGGQGTKWRRNIPENFNRLKYGARALQTDDRRTGDSIIANVKREREFTFAKNHVGYCRIFGARNVITVKKDVHFLVPTL